jgi:hypothetical protein
MNLLSTLRVIFVRAALVALGVVLALLAAEIGARIWGPPYQQQNSSYRCNRWLGWQGVSNLSREVTTNGGKHMAQLNASGMHDQAYEIAKPNDTFRILVLGDSFVEALQVDLAETMQTWLERDLQPQMPPGQKVEVIAAAAGGWSPANQLMFFRGIGQHLQPDLVLVLWVPENDLSDILPESRLTYEGINCYAPYFVLCDGAFDPGPWFSAPGVPPASQACSPTHKRLVSLLNRLYQASFLYQRLEPLLTAHYHKLEYANPYAPWLEQSQQDPTLDYAYELTEGVYTRLAQEAADMGAETAFVITPSKQALMVEYDPDYLRELQEGGMEAGGSSVDVTLPSQRFVDVMAQQHLPTLDLFPLFLEQLNTGQGPFYGEKDTHWNAKGNRLAAELIAQWLVASSLVPTETE